MTNDEKAKKIVLSKPFNDASSQDYAYKCAMQMAEWKDEQFKNQEQTLLWTVEHMLDRLCIEGEAREIAIKEFTNDLLYYNEKEDDSEE